MPWLKSVRKNKPASHKLGSLKFRAGKENSNSYSSVLTCANPCYSSVQAGHRLTANSVQRRKALAEVGILKTQKVLQLQLLHEFSASFLLLQPGPGLSSMLSFADTVKVKPEDCISFS